MEISKYRIAMIALLIASALVVGVHNYVYSQKSIADEWDGKFVSINGNYGHVTCVDDTFILKGYKNGYMYTERADGSVVSSENTFTEGDKRYYGYRPTDITYYIDVKGSHIVEVKVEKVVVEIEDKDYEYLKAVN